jgi:hypothetical protein
LRACGILGIIYFGIGGAMALLMVHPPEGYRP